MLSSTVANALENEDLFYTKSTRKFIRTFDKLFDCLNGMSSSNYGKPERAPYRKIDDSRFKVVLSISIINK